MSQEEDFAGKEIFVLEADSLSEINNALAKCSQAIMKSSMPINVGDDDNPASVAILVTMRETMLIPTFIQRREFYPATDDPRGVIRRHFQIQNSDLICAVSL